MPLMAHVRVGTLLTIFSGNEIPVTRRFTRGVCFDVFLLKPLCLKDIKIFSDSFSENT